MENIKKHIGILGLKVEDRVTGATGVAISVCFDLYGCIQVIMDRGLDKDGKNLDRSWYDIARLKIVDKTPVMQLPNFSEGKQSEGRQGAAEKPTPAQ